MNRLISKSDLTILQNDLLSAALSINNLKEYCDYAFLRLHEFVKMDSASLNVCVFKDNMVLEELKCFFFKKSIKMEKSYVKHHSVDFVAPLIIGTPRTVFHAMNVISPEQFWETELFNKHCKPFDVHNAIMVAGKIPGHKHKYIILYLYAEDPKRLFTIAEVNFVDTIFPTLFSTLLHRAGRICDETMIEQVTLLNKFSGAPETMKLIKHIVKNPSYTRQQYLDDLNKEEGTNIKPGTLDSRFQAIFEKLEIRQYEDGLKEGKDKTRRILNLKYQVFENFMFLRN